MAKHLQHTKRVMLARRYCNERGECTSNSMFIEGMEFAKKAFNLYTSLDSTLYACLFSPVDKRGSRTQLKRYIYRSSRFTFEHNINKSKRFQAARFEKRTGVPLPPWVYGADGKHLS